jgi:hypothetical protein
VWKAAVELRDRLASLPTLPSALISLPSMESADTGKHSKRIGIELVNARFISPPTF